MSFEVRLKRSAEKELMGLDDQTRQRVVTALEILASGSESIDTKKLKGTDGYRLRVGDYRILYTISRESSIIEIYAIAHRKDAHRR